MGLVSGFLSKSASKASFNSLETSLLSLSVGKTTGLVRIFSMTQYSFYPSNGTWPYIRANRVTPRAHTSALNPSISLMSGSHPSGGKKWKVPSVWLIMTSSGVFAINEQPKSANTQWPLTSSYVSCPVYLNNMFYGLISLCIIPSKCI